MQHHRRDITDSSFKNNFAVQYCGAIFNDSTINSISGVSFSGNSATSADGNAAGGAFYNFGTITAGLVELGDVTDNYAEGVNAAGVAIYNENENMAISITGVATDNHVSAGSGTVLGGAIYNEGALTVNAMYIENNHAESSGDTAYGGAIYVDNDGEGSTINVTGNITGNYAVASSGDARGGAIYTSGDVNVTADGTDISISVNYAEGSDGTDDNAIYLSTADGTVTFDIFNNGSVTYGGQHPRRGRLQR